MGIPLIVSGTKDYSTTPLAVVVPLNPQRTDLNRTKGIPELQAGIFSFYPGK